MKAQAFLGNLPYVRVSNKVLKFYAIKEKIQREKEKRLQEATLVIKKRYGKNAILKGTNYQEGATMRERNQQIGGHRA